MSDLSELYQELILDHNKKPRNFRPMADADAEAKGHNPLCGDQCTIYIKVEEGIIEDISFEGSGCAISKASASMMTTALKGKSEEEALKIFDEFHEMVTAPDEKEAESVAERLGKLAVFSGVREYPARVKCASLAWHTLQAALEKKAAAVTTE